MTPRDDVHYEASGMHSSGETSIAVGILRYRSIDDASGEWLLVSRDESDRAALASSVEPFARLIGAEGFDSELWPLDGQNIAAEGLVLAERDGVVDLAVDALSKVSDLFPDASNSFGEPGMHRMGDGRLFLAGWVAGTEGGTTTITDAAPSEGGGNAVALIHKAGKGPPDGVYFDASVSVIEDGPVPVVEVIDGGGFSSQKPIGMLYGASPDWYDVERAGIKDLLGGRHRVVGILTGGGEALDDMTIPRIMITEPQVSRYRLDDSGVVELDDPEGLINAPSSALLRQPYVAVEGELSIAEMRLVVDRFEQIQTPIPTP